MTGDPIAVAFQVAAALQACGIPYVVGGSLASSFSGEPRSTLDVDMLVAITPAEIPRLLEALGEQFHADEQAFRRAIRDRSSVNVIHLPTATKIDLFVMGGSAIDDQQMTRRRKVQVGRGPDRHLYISTPEDILLQKLRWYHLGHGVSDRQWRDILGIIIVQGTALDVPYLRRGATLLGIAELLDRAFHAAGSAPPPEDQR